jgi:hypothetical protein
MTVKERIQPGKGRSCPDIHLDYSLPAAAPLAGQNDIRRNVVGAKIGPDSAGLRAATFIKVALCCTIINLEM